MAWPQIAHFNGGSILCIDEEATRGMVKNIDQISWSAATNVSLFGFRNSPYAGDTSFRCLCFLAESGHAKSACGAGMADTVCGCDAAVSGEHADQPGA